MSCSRYFSWTGSASNSSGSTTLLQKRVRGRGVAVLGIGYRFLTKFGVSVISIRWTKLLNLKKLEEIDVKTEKFEENGKF